LDGIKAIIRKGLDVLMEFVIHLAGRQNEYKYHDTGSQCKTFFLHVDIAPWCSISAWKNSPRSGSSGPTEVDTVRSGTEVPDKDKLKFTISHFCRFTQNSKMVTGQTYNTN